MTSPCFNIFIMSLLNEQKLGARKVYGNEGEIINYNASLELSPSGISGGLSYDLFNLLSSNISIGSEGVPASVGIKVNNSTYYFGPSINPKDTSLTFGVETESDTSDSSIKNVSVNETTFNVNTLLLAAVIVAAPVVAGAGAAAIGSAVQAIFSALG